MTENKCFIVYNLIIMLITIPIFFILYSNQYSYFQLHDKSNQNTLPNQFSLISNQQRAPFLKAKFFYLHVFWAEAFTLISLLLVYTTHCRIRYHLQSFVYIIVEVRTRHPLQYKQIITYYVNFACEGNAKYLNKYLKKK